MGCTPTFRPPRNTPPVASASDGGATGIVTVPSSCCSVACNTRTGTAGTTNCVNFSLSRTFSPPSSSAPPSHEMLTASGGTVTPHSTSFALPAASTTSCGASVIGSRTRSALLPPTALLAVAASEARTFISRDVVLRSVSIAVNWSPSRTSGGRPGSICRSCVTLMLVWPSPNCWAPASATATRRKLVSESLMGTCTTASPFASSATSAFHSSSVSNSSRVGLRPPPPPAASALRP